MWNLSDMYNKFVFLKPEKEHKNITIYHSFRRMNIVNKWMKIRKMTDTPNELQNLAYYVIHILAYLYIVL
jgi:hypothetical protein